MVRLICSSSKRKGSKDLEYYSSSMLAAIEAYFICPFKKGFVSFGYFNGRDKSDTRKSIKCKSALNCHNYGVILFGF